MTRRVADDLLDVLVEAGVHRVYGLVGDSLNSFSDAVRRSGGSANGGIDWVHVHNEEAAAFAASAEAQLTGRLAVCAGSCGPGNTHLIQGVMDAHRSGAPVIALATQIPSRQIGTGYFQETKPEALFAQASHYCETVAHPDQVVRLTRSAVQNAVGEAGRRCAGAARRHPRRSFRWQGQASCHDTQPAATHTGRRRDRRACQPHPSRQQDRHLRWHRLHRRAKGSARAGGACSTLRSDTRCEAKTSCSTTTLSM